MDFSGRVTYKLFCSMGTPEANCTNEAVGEVPIYVDNNPLPGKEAVWLPICQVHLDALDKRKHK